MNKMKVGKCVRSGTCCKQAPCGFGHWNETKTACAYLGFDDDNLAFCSHYDEIIKDPTSVVSPAFGTGCCSGLFNERRNEIIKERYNGVIPTQYIDI